MKVQDILTERRRALTEIVQTSFDSALPHSRGFVLRVLLPELTVGLLNIEGFDFSDDFLKSVRYGGFPYIAYLGFGIGAHQSTSEVPQSVIKTFVSEVQKMQDREGDRLKEFISDDVAVLGIADGISILSKMHVDNTRYWLIKLLSRHPSENIWSSRMRLLAGDLLDNRGRLRTRISENNPDKIALELCLRTVWPYVFQDLPYPTEQERQTLMKELLTAPLPDGDLERAAVWLKSLDLLINEAVEGLTSSVSDVVRILKNTQHSFKRWIWDEKTRRGRVAPARWLIDNERHVQSFLWAVLYPIYGSDLVDETYLPGYGQVQPRFDLGITSLKLIIEVKVLRERKDFAAIEEQVAGDLGLYFKDTKLFNRMIVYIYDDCDTPYPEKYDALRTALKNREHIEEVIIVRRPSMIPSRNSRLPLPNNTEKKNETA